MIMRLLDNEIIRLLMIMRLLDNEIIRLLMIMRLLDNEVMRLLRYQEEDNEAVDDREDGGREGVDNVPQCYQPPENLDNAHNTDGSDHDCCSRRAGGGRRRAVGCFFVLKNDLSGDGSVLG